MSEDLTDTQLFFEVIEPRRANGMSISEIAAETGIDEARIRQVVEVFDTPYSQIEGRKLFAEVVETIKRHFHFEKESYVRLVALFAMQGHLAVGLPGVFYIAVPGGKGCGKTNLLDLIRVLTSGQIFENISEAAFARSIIYGRVTCIDEADVRRGKDVNDVRDALIRQGYKAGGSKYTRWNAAKRETEEISVYGPKAVAYRGEIDAALLDRSYIVPVEKYLGEDGYKYTRLNIWKKVGDLPERLSKWGYAAIKAFPMDMLEKLSETPEFVEKVKRTTESFGASRGTELAIYANLVAHMAGIDITEDVAASDRIRSIEDDTAEDQAEIIVALLDVLEGEDAQKNLVAVKEIRIHQKAVKDRVNAGRTQRGERPISDARFKVLRREIGIREAWIRNYGNRNVWAIPVSFILNLQANMGNMPNIPDNPVQQDLRVSQVSQVRQLREDRDKGVAYDMLIAKYGQELVEREKIPRFGGRP